MKGIAVVRISPPVAVGLLGALAGASGWATFSVHYLNRADALTVVAEQRLKNETLSKAVADRDARIEELFKLLAKRDSRILALSRSSPTPPTSARAARGPSVIPPIPDLYGYVADGSQNREAAKLAWGSDGVADDPQNREAQKLAWGSGYMRAR
jgi:hypothetical protein